MGRPARLSRDQILATARSHFAATGFDSTTLSAIATSLEVTPAAILRHFPSKQELFAAAMMPAVVAPPDCVLRLESEDGTGDPRRILRDLATEFIPFLRSILGASLAVTMHLRKRQTAVVLPFDPSEPASPPQRAIRILTQYFARSIKAGTIEIDNPRAAALLFIGSLQSYVLMHHVMNISPVYPLDDYVGALIDLWTRGAIRKPRRRKK